MSLAAEARVPSPAPAALPPQLKIATYNVENYGSLNRRTPHGFRANYPKSEAAKRALRQTIREIDADILVLQEMGPVEYLLELQRDLKAEGSDYPYSVLMRGPDAARHIAALSRIPFARVHEHSPLRFEYQDGVEDVKRGLLELHFATPAGPLTLWALHLKSRYTTNKADPESAIRRAAEAMRIREFILQRIADTQADLYLILGDFNDTKVSPPLRYLMQRSELKFSHLLPSSDSRGEHWTYHNTRDDSYSRVDHILASSAVLPFVKNGSAEIADGPQVRSASDHRPIFVTLDFSAFPQSPNWEVPRSLED
ncbi:hypothetical protein AXK12_03855 [Cephaloticoccus capnophilus]|uniref:Endonuclease/exonuclease/phosphatase domain-containing protein n=1 Tax=Cephaloticoccus capnophilus TaxID=1548208 RepID=A0A139SNR4_9BACT|nr:hypothetical protein AXK12_03855 [Cephaloticoccus capnophilus]